MPSLHASALRRGTRVAWAAALGALLVAACGASPAVESERADDEHAADTSIPEETTSTPTEPLVQPTDGAVRSEVRGLASNEAPAHVLLVGDSVAVLVADDLARRVSSTLHVDAADCRRIDMDVNGSCGAVPSGRVVTDGIEAIETNMSELAADGIVPDAAVIVLANNSSLDRQLLAQAMLALEGVPRVWWVTTRIEGFGRQDPNNAHLHQLAAGDERVGVIDWYEASEDEDWLADHVHPNPAGERALARLIARHLVCDCVP